MAGSYEHCCNDDGSFRFDLIENMGDAHEACEDMHKRITDLEAKLAEAKAEMERVHSGLEELHDSLPECGDDGFCPKCRIASMMRFLDEAIDQARGEPNAES